MSDSSNARYLCPFCKARVKLVEQQASSDKFSVGGYLLSELGFWAIFLIVLAVGFWRWLVGAVLFVIALIVWRRWDQRRRVFRCEGCQTILTYREAISHRHQR